MRAGERYAATCAALVGHAGAAAGLGSVTTSAVNDAGAAVADETTFRAEGLASAGGAAARSALVGDTTTAARFTGRTGATLDDSTATIADRTAFRTGRTAGSRRA